jgi:intracellular sulfur oxidation DsrE/DsrF family protein
MTVDNNETKVTKEERIVDYIKSVAALDEAIEPFKEQKKALKQNYVENNWLDKDEIKLAMKAYKMIKDDIDLDQLMDFYETVDRGV